LAFTSCVALAPGYGMCLLLVAECYHVKRDVQSFIEVIHKKPFHFRKIMKEHDKIVSQFDMLEVPRFFFFAFDDNIITHQVFYNTIFCYLQKKTNWQMYNKDRYGYISGFWTVSVAVVAVMIVIET
jgi:hypothetical protein